MLQRNIDRPRMVLGTRVPQRIEARAGHDTETEAISSLLRSLRRNFRLVVATTVIGTTLAFAVVLSVTPQYRASVELLVDPRRTQLLKDRQVVDGPGTDNGVIESEAEMLQSPALMRRVAERLNLLQDDEFGSPGLIGRVKALILWPVRNLLGIGGRGDPLAGVAGALAAAVDAKRRGLTYVIELTVWSRDAAKSARLANKIADLYIADQIAAKRDTAKQVTQWLNQRVDDLRERVTASENAYEKYKAESGLFDTGGENLSDRQIQQLSEQVVQARAQAAQAQAKYEELKQITPDKLQVAAASPDVLQSGVVSNLRGQYADTAKNAAELTTRYGPQHPKVQIAQAQLKNLSGQITEEISRIVASAKSEYEMAKSRQESLEASLNDLKQRAGQFNQAAIRLHELEREAQANRDLFQAFLSRAKETSAQLDMQLPDSRVISAASVPTKPSYPSRVPLIGIAFFGSLGLGVTMVLARAALAKGVRDAEDIVTLFGLYPLASIPLVESPRSRPAITRGAVALGYQGLLGKASQAGPDNAGTSPQPELVTRLADIVFDRPDSPFAEHVRSLCLTLKHAKREADIRVVLVTSARAREGKSTLALNIARAAAASGDRVLLIDGDLRRPSIAQALGIGESWGLADILTGRSSLKGSVRRDPRTGLYLIAGQAGVSGNKALTLLSSNGMARLISMARESFDHVVIDASPLLPIADTRRLIDCVDGVIMVVALEETPREAVAAALRNTPSLEERLLGVVLNKSVDDLDRYYYERTAVADTQGASS
jgi:succinoglycan biosynthesis transport protein ExoP